VSAVAIPSEVVNFLPCFFFFGDSRCGFLAVDFRDPLDFAFDFGGSLRGVLPPAALPHDGPKKGIVGYMDLCIAKN
jgi:hypothetical protein